MFIFLPVHFNKNFPHSTQLNLSFPSIFALVKVLLPSAGTLKSSHKISL